ncbi:MAG: lysophospholipid acyltransferase family protein [candidate division Zixibacteria bacterium]|nr:lysophospholipid acyltransferase family protein [candidate division Zixibacteria bacterium]
MTPPVEHAALFSLIGMAGAGLVTALGHTLSVRFLHPEYVEQARTHAGRVIYAFWHEGLLVATYVFRHRGIRVLVSQHRDGEYISQTIERMGYTTVRGSTTRGGTAALFGMAAAGRTADLGITVDGPRGPRHQAQPGVCHIARRSGLPILPFAVACSRQKRLSSWDRFIVPLPFARVTIAFGEPILVPPKCRGESVEALRLELEQRLHTAIHVATEDVGDRQRDKS